MRRQVVLVMVLVDGLLVLNDLFLVLQLLRNGLGCLPEIKYLLGLKPIGFVLFLYVERLLVSSCAGSDVAMKRGR